MSSLALMRWLESAPERYDAGMRAITLGRVGRIHDAVAEAAGVRDGSRVLEIGCGTGAITERLVKRGAHVTAVDQNPAMLEQARARLADCAAALDFVERTAAEIDALPEGVFDAVVAGFCLSEMSAGERAYVLEHAARRLAPEGVLVVADEVRPERGGARLLYGLLRLPQAGVAWLVAGSLSRPIPDLRGELERCGLVVEGEQRWLLGSLALFRARRVA